MRQCRWCKRFVRKDTKPTVRTYRSSDNSWHTGSQTLCPDCSKSWSTDLPWNRAATPSEAAVAVTLR